MEVLGTYLPAGRNDFACSLRPQTEYEVLLRCFSRATEKSHFGLDSLFDRLAAGAQNLSRVELFGFVGQDLPNGADKAKPQVRINVDFSDT